MHIDELIRLFSILKPLQLDFLLGHAPLLTSLFKIFPKLLRWLNANAPIDKRVYIDPIAAYNKKEMKPFTFKAAKYDWETASKSLTIFKVHPLE